MRSRSGEAFDQAEALREGGAALEPDVEPLVEERPEGVRDPVVLLDEADGEPVLVGDDPEQVVEVATLVDKHP